MHSAARKPKTSRRRLAHSPLCSIVCAYRKKATAAGHSPARGEAAPDCVTATPAVQVLYTCLPALLGCFDGSRGRYWCIMLTWRLLLLLAMMVSAEGLRAVSRYAALISTAALKVCTSYCNASMVFAY